MANQAYATSFTKAAVSLSTALLIAAQEIENACVADLQRLAATCREFAAGCEMVALKQDIDGYLMRNAPPFGQPMSRANAEINVDIIGSFGEAD